jgi:Na+/phosphate symporter
MNSFCQTAQLSEAESRMFDHPAFQLSEAESRMPLPLVNEEMSLEVAEIVKRTVAESTRTIQGVTKSCMDNFFLPMVHQQVQGALAMVGSVLVQKENEAAARHASFEARLAKLEAQGEKQREEIRALKQQNRELVDQVLHFNRVSEEANARFRCV